MTNQQAPYHDEAAYAPTASPSPGPAGSSVPETDDPPIVDPALARSAARSAVRSALHTANDSAVYCREADAALPRIGRDELVLGDLLGQGGFNDVYEVRSVRLNSLRPGEEDFVSLVEEENNNNHRSQHAPIAKGTSHTADTTGTETDESSNKKQNSSPASGGEGSSSSGRWQPRDLDRAELARRFLARHCLRPTEGDSAIDPIAYPDLCDARYAVKHLSPKTLSETRSYKTGAADLAVEAKLLSSLSHPNLVRIRGVAAGGLEGFATGRPDSYFLILDRLYGTLDATLDGWRDKSVRLNSVLRRRFLDKRGRKRRAFLADRMQVAMDVAAAMSYLHGRGVIYRDLKPDNIGFDIRGDVKIFDLGLSKELRPSSAQRDGTYNLSGNTGSLRYMAPEVALSKPYNLSADVYSFSVLLHEIMSLRVPYDGMSRRVHADAVVLGTVRPVIDTNWPSRTKCALQRGWDAAWFERPRMRDWYRVLRRDVALLRGRSDVEGLVEEEDRLTGASRRRSTYVLSAPVPSAGSSWECGGGKSSSSLPSSDRCPSPLSRVGRKASSSSTSNNDGKSKVGSPAASLGKKVITDVDDRTVENAAVAVASAQIRHERVTRGALAA